MINFISILLSVGFGYLFFKIARPKLESGSKSIYYARTFLAWSLFASTSFYIRPFVVDQSVNNIIYWLMKLHLLFLQQSLAIFMEGLVSNLYDLKFTI